MISRKAVLAGHSEIGRDDIRHFIFEIPELDLFDFVPGQFVSFTEQIGEKKITRAYSIASPPLGNNRFELCINLVQDGKFTPTLWSKQIGDSLDVKGPSGGFVMHKPPRDCIFVATGTGIAPFRSMAIDLLKRDSETKMTLIFGTRYEQNLTYVDELEALAAAHPNFKFVYAVSRPSEEWKGRSGRVQQYLIDALGDRTDLDVYICGLKEMVDDVRNLLKERGFDKKQIVYERYD